MSKPIIPALAERFTGIAPDLPGIGDSDIPIDGLDLKSAAVRIHDLAKSLGVQRAEVVGTTSPDGRRRRAVSGGRF